MTAGVWAALWEVKQPLIALQPWRPPDTTSLLAVLVLTMVIAVPPLANVGRADAEGNRYYRAYFTADLVWHTALTAEIAKFSMPPRNPYLASQRIHYYWTYFLLPAAISESGPAALRDVERCLVLNALATGLLFMSAVFLGAWVAVGRPVAVALGVGLTLAASSAEGAYALHRLWSHGEPLSGVKHLNIDAVTAWPPFGGHRIDGLQRCLWYVPQHSMAYALGLIAIIVAAAAGSAASRLAIALTGIAIGCSVAFNPFVGGVFALAHALAVTVDAWAVRARCRTAPAYARDHPRGRRADLVLREPDGRRRWSGAAVRLPGRIAQVADPHAPAVPWADPDRRCRRSVAIARRQVRPTRAIDGPRGGVVVPAPLRSAVRRYGVGRLSRGTVDARGDGSAGGTLHCCRMAGTPPRHHGGGRVSCRPGRRSDDGD
jgi:hypothetical protein